MAHDVAEMTFIARPGDDGTKDFRVSEVMRTDEQQGWFVAERPLS
jgi:hypothetical protein